MEWGREGVVSEVFLGSALNAVDAKGRLSVPAFIRSELDRTSAARVVLIGVHETKPCLTVYGASYTEFLRAELERRRLGEEVRGGDLDELEDRAAGIFGMTERVPYDTSGRIVLSAALREEGRIADLALFIGKDRFAELWDPKLALEHGGERQRRLVDARLRERGVTP